MPRYVIEMDKPLEKCLDCPFALLTNDGLGEAIFCTATITIGVKTIGDFVAFYDERMRPRPEWCPLKPLEDSSLDKRADATLTPQ